METMVNTEKSIRTNKKRTNKLSVVETPSTKNSAKDFYMLEERPMFKAEEIVSDYLTKTRKVG